LESALDVEGKEMLNMRQMVCHIAAPAYSMETISNAGDVGCIFQQPSSNSIKEIGSVLTV